MENLTAIFFHTGFHSQFMLENLLANNFSLKFHFYRSNRLFNTRELTEIQKKKIKFCSFSRLIKMTIHWIFSLFNCTVRQNIDERERNRNVNEDIIFWWCVPLSILLKNFTTVCMWVKLNATKTKVRRVEIWSLRFSTHLERATRMEKDSHTVENQ